MRRFCGAVKTFAKILRRGSGNACVSTVDFDPIPLELTCQMRANSRGTMFAFLTGA